MNEQNFQMLYQGSLQTIGKPYANRSFRPATLRLFAVDTVANNTKYSKEVILKALPSLRNIPLVGLLKGDDFGSHESKLDLDEEEGIRTVYNTTPFGLIPESANFWFETVDVNGEEREFLCVDVLLWKRQHKEFKTLARRKSFNISMEVVITDFEKERSGVIQVKDFYFTAVCVLGNQVTPAFKGARVELTYTENDPAELKHMMLEFEEQVKKLNLNGGESVPTVKDQKPEEVVETPVVEEEVQVEETPVVEDPQPEIIEPSEEAPVVETPEEGTQPEVAEVQPEVVEEVPVQEPTLQETYEALQVEHQELVKALMEQKQSMEQLTSDYEALKQERDALQGFKDEVLAERRQSVETALFSQFEDLEGTPEFDALKEKASEYSVDALETQLYALMGKKLYSEQQAQKNLTKPTETHVVYENAHVLSTPTDSVFGLLDLYLKK